MIYFDNAATGGRKPDVVQTAVTSAIKVCANPGRGGHRLSLSCANLVQCARKTLNEFFDGYGFDRTVFTKNCTEALNLAIFGVLKKGDHVIASCMEHNSVLRPLERLQNEGFVTYDICPLKGAPENGETQLDLSRLKKLLRPNTRLVAVTSASNVTGENPDLLAVKSILPKDVLFLVDGAQGAGHFPIQMKRAGIDLLTIAGHKGMLGIQGSGALLFSERVNPSPLLFGGTGSLSISLAMPDFYPDALEAGTLSYPAVVSLMEGARYLTTRQTDVQHTIYALSERLITALRSFNNYVVYSKPNPCGIVAFRHKEAQSELVANFLSKEHDIATRGGLHCAPLMHEALGTLDEGLTRVSFSHDNTQAEIDALLFALQDFDKRKDELRFDCF